MYSKPCSRLQLPGSIYFFISSHVLILTIFSSPLQNPTLLKFVFNVVEFPHIDNVRSKRLVSFSNANLVSNWSSTCSRSWAIIIDPQRIKITAATSILGFL